MGNNLFRDVAVFIPTKTSLVADNRPLLGPFADPSAMEGLFTWVIKKNPTYAVLYSQRADLRARYLHKWSEAAEDLAKAIEFNPDDVHSWRCRAMLLAKLQQADLLSEHLTKMLAKFQNNSAAWGPLTYCLATFPTARPELVRGREVLASKRSDTPGQFWLAVARYRAGKYEQAEALFSAAAAKSPLTLTTGDGVLYSAPIFLAFHAMIKARLNDREAAGELLSKAREALKKAILGNHGTAPGDYGENWWERLIAEALLAEAESLINGAKQPASEGKWDLPPGAPPPAVAPFDALAARQHQAAWAKYLGAQPEVANSVGMKLVLIPPGEFTMGSPKALIEEELRLRAGDGWYGLHLPGEGPQHRVRITKPYWLGATDVTQEEYQRVMGGNPSKFQGAAKRPVEQVSWDEAVEFCRRLSEFPAEKAEKRRYGLPSEAQWEHACRAGTTTRWYFGDDKAGFADVAWFLSNAGGQTHPVGQKRANAWGLYDMCGNVWQWCLDWYDMDYYAMLTTDDPAGPPGGLRRVRRGGGYIYGAERCRSAARLSLAPGECAENVGFRVLMVQAAAPADEKKAK